MPYNRPMGKLTDLDEQGVTDLTSYLIGIMNERERIVKALENFDDKDLRRLHGQYTYTRFSIDEIKEYLFSSGEESSAV